MTYNKSKLSLQERKISDLKVDKNQPRKDYKQETIDGIAETIKEQGVIQPIEIDENNIIVTGEMRYRASKQAGLKTVPVKVLEGLTPDDRYVRQVVENMQREDFGPFTNMKIVEKLKKMFPHLSDKELGKKIGKSGKFIGDYTVGRLAPGYIQQPLKEGKIDIDTVVRLETTPGEHKKQLTRTTVRDGIPRDGVRILKERLKTATPEEADKLFKQSYKGMNAAAVAVAARNVAPNKVEKPSVAYEELEQLSNALLNFLRANSNTIFQDSVYERKVKNLLSKLSTELTEYVETESIKMKAEVVN